jgi:parallel beta-helix repeat protein
MSIYYKNPNGRVLCILFLSFISLLCLSVFVLPATAADESSVAVTDTQLMDLNIPFIANSGQQPADVEFYADTFYGRAFVTTTDLTHAVAAPTDDRIRGVALKEQFVSAHGTAISFVPIGEDPAETKVSYFIGNDASTWQTDLPTYNLVSLGEIWPGITVKAKAHGATIEKLFTVAPGALPDAIRVKVQGADSLRIADDGSLVIVTGDGEVSLTAPRAYQDGQEVPVMYCVLDEVTYGFTVREYDRTKAFLIDPSLSYSTYLGGSDRDNGYSIAVDTTGSAYVGGYTYSTNFPTVTGAYQTTYGSGTSDAFVTKLNPDGSGLAYSTYLGGSLVDQVYGIAVDSSGNAYVAGYTTSSDFPTTEGAYRRTLSGTQDGIIVQLNPSGTSLLYSTYLGGATVVYSSQGQEEIDGITVDNAGKIYVTGRTGASDFPVTAGAYNTTMPHTTGGSLFGFISVINPAGSGTGDLTYSTYLGGDMGTHYSRAIVLDSSGMIYVAGQTTSDIFPVTTGAFQTTKQYAGDSYNGFLSKINPAGSGTGDLVYSTYLAGTDGHTYPRGIGVDTAGIYVVGYTASTDFPTTTGAYQTTNAGGNDAFVCTINPEGSGTSDLVYSTYFGGTDTDYGYGSALDSSGTVYLTGSTYSPDLPTTTGAYQTSLSGTRDAFVVKINPAGSGTGDLVYSTYLGGTGTDGGYAIALDSADNAYLTGLTASTDFPVTTGASQATYGGGSYDAFVTTFIFASVPVPPIAAFNSDVQTGTAPLTVHFTDASTGTPTSWAWDFTNDGTVDSTTQSPSHIYDTAGTYTVNLTVTNAGGSDSEVKTDYITVNAAGPKTWYVDDSGGADFTTIQAAVTTAIAGDTIIVRDGIYNENIYIDNKEIPGTPLGEPGSAFTHKRQGLTLRSENGRDAVTVNTYLTSKAVFIIEIPQITIDGFTINGTSSYSWSGISVSSSTTNGFYTFTNNAFNDVAYGVNLGESRAGYSTVSNNTISLVNYMAAGQCILLKNSNNNIVINNTCRDSGHRSGTSGIYLYRGSSSYNCTNNTVSGNTFDGCGYGVYLTSVTANNIFDNTITNSKYGIYLKSTSSLKAADNVLYANNVINSTTAYVGFADSYSLTNYWNSQTAQTYWFNGASYTGQVGNYWGGYAVTDADGNGIGDSPYQTRATPAEFDNYPLIGEWNNGEITYTPPVVIAPVAAFTSDFQTGTAPLTVNFTDQSTNTPTSWAWDVNNDGTVDYATKNATHTFTAAGNYTANLTVTNAGGSDSEVKTDYITVNSAPVIPALLWGPYLTGTMTTGTVVNVKTNIATAVSVEYATDTYYTAHSAYDQSATDSVSTQLHHVSLAGLTPDTLYHYRVVYAGQPTGDLHFSTFAESGPFTFVVYSDTQDQLPTYSQLERHKLVADRIAEEPDVAFVLNSGDLVNDASDLANWDRYFAAGSKMMANTTVYPALGNHDNNDPNYYQNYGVPEYYSFDCGDGHIAVLDSNDWAWNDLPVQSAWLANDLQTDKPFKFISFHHPLYTSETKHFGGWENLRLEWEDDFNANDVLAVFNGHVHAYERFQVNNITYFVAGIGGGPSYNLATPRYTGSQNSLEYMIGYIRVTIDPAAKTATAQVIRVADVSSDLKTLTTVYPPGTVFETVVMSLPEVPVAPTAAFTADVQSGTAPLTVHFTDQSTNTPTSWAWDFTNDGSVDSTEQSPSHTYSTAGTYTVNLTVTNAAGSDSEVMTGFITATEPAQLRVLNVDTGVRYATIQAAVNAATAGDTLVVSDGAFTENVDVDKQLTIHSENGASAVTVTAALPTVPVFDVNANGVIIQGFTVRGPTDTHVAGIEIVGFNDCLIVGNDCSGCYNGIHIGGTGTNNTVTENYCHGNTQRGISIRDTAHDNYILKNTVESNTDAGICIKDTTAANVLWLNNVIGNRVEILTENIVHSPNPITYTYNGGTYTSYLGNYYFDFSGADTDGNGVGTPAYSYGTYGDGYPLMGQYANYIETTLIAPTAVFIADVTSGTAPLTVEFTDQSAGLIDSYAWDFENDGTVDSTAQSPSYTYSTVGTYTVKLTVTNTAGSDSEVKTGYIGVSSPSSRTALLIQPEAPSVILGGTRTVNIMLSEAADGLAGYNITITLADGTKAEIIGASFPGWASVHQQGEVPGDLIWLKGLDLNKQVEAGAMEVVLATITIRGDEIGTTAITAKANMMDDDDGTTIDPAAAESSLSVIRQVPQLPGYPAPTDPNSDGMYEDLNGNGRMDFNDVVLFFNSMEWISDQDGFGYFDFNRNGRIDFDDVVRLFWGV